MPVIFFKLVRKIISITHEKSVTKKNCNVVFLEHVLIHNTFWPITLYQNTKIALPDTYYKTHSIHFDQYHNMREQKLVSGYMYLSFKVGLKTILKDLSNYVISRTLLFTKSLSTMITAWAPFVWATRTLVTKEHFPRRTMMMWMKRWCWSCCRTWRGPSDLSCARALCGACSFAGASLFPFPPADWRSAVARLYGYGNEYGMGMSSYTLANYAPEYSRTIL